MERLTERNNDGCAVMKCKECELKDSDCCTAYRCRNRLKDRLAAYEDIGLEPSEIEMMFDTFCKTVEKDYEEIKKLEAKLSAYRALGTVEDFQRLVTAQNEGRLVELPCNVGDNIYWINDEENCVSVHKNGIKGIVVRNGGFAIEDTDGYIDIAGTKYCYLTREEAEVALAKESEGK